MAGRGLDTTARRVLRQSEAQPFLEVLIAWLYASRRGMAYGGATGKVIDYSLNAGRSWGL